MHKKLENDLISLAHSVLQMKNRDNVFLLKDKSKEIYEKLSVLAFVEEFVNSTPGLKETKSDLLEKVDKGYELKETVIDEESIIEEPIIVEEIEVEVEGKVVYNLIEEEVKEESIVEKELSIITKEEVVLEKKEIIKEKEIEQPFDELEDIIFAKNDTAVNFKNDARDVGGMKTFSLEEELQDTISVDVMADLFEDAKPKSLNDKLSTNIQIGLNDRITFVKNLFNGNQEDYNRVVSQLNTFKTQKEANEFIVNMVKPDYNWTEKEELETRFMEIIERKFA
jgi:hypothetical protein